MKKGTFIISLDLEIHWGVSDHRSIENYRENLANVPAVVKRLLGVFSERGIHVTWATVGMLFCKSREEIFSLVQPALRPDYNNKALSNYEVALHAGSNEEEDPFHFAPSLVRQILGTNGQELATHTFSHYYCLEPGQTPQQFSADIMAANKVASTYNTAFSSIVFPRNQYNGDYIGMCKLNGIGCFRGNYPSRLYRPEAKSTESSFKRLGRLLDAYFPVTGQRTVEVSEVAGLLNIPASAFLRPFNKKLAFAEGFRIKRIKKEMESAAKSGKIYHLWWHPHNFGAAMDENFSILDTILDHFNYLKNKYGMQSFNMGEMYDRHQRPK